MTTTLTKSNIESAAHNNVLELIDTRANIADPRDPEGKKTRQFVYDVDPFLTGIKFNQFPYIFRSTGSRFFLLSIQKISQFC